MRKVTEAIAAFSAALLMWIGEPSAQQRALNYDTVHVRVDFGGGQQIGQGVLAKSAGRCLVILPRHVVLQGAREPGRIDITTRDGITTQADLQRAVEGADLAILAANISANACPPPPPTVGVEAALDTEARGVLQRINPSGGVSRQFVRITGFERGNVTVAPETAGETIQQGLSGSLLVAGGVPIGILLSVENGEGVVLRLDRVRELVGGAWVVSSGSGGSSASGGVVSTLPPRTVDVHINVTRRVNPQGQPWDSVFGVGRLFWDPDPMVFVRFADGTGVMLGFPEVTELSRQAVSQIGMAWTDVCSNKYECVRQGVEVRGDRFDEVIVIDYDPEINAMSKWEVLGSSSSCRIDALCDVGGAQVRFTPSTGTGAAAPTAGTLPGLPAGYQPRTALGRLVMGQTPAPMAQAPSPSPSPSPEQQAPPNPLAGGYVPQTELGRQLLASRCTPARQAMRRGASEMMGINSSSMGALLVGGALSTVLDTCERFLASEAERRAVETGVVGPASRREWTSPSRADVRGGSTVIANTPGTARAQCKRVRSVAYVDGRETATESQLCRGASGWERRA